MHVCMHYLDVDPFSIILRTSNSLTFKPATTNYPKPVSDLDIFKDYLLCTAEHGSLRSRKPKLYGDIKSRYPKITAAMEKIIIFLSRHIS